MLEYDKTVCKICGKKCKSEKGLIAHVSQIHKIKTKEYYDKYFKTECEGICKNYGKYDFCKKYTNYLNYSKGYRDFCSLKCVSNNEIIKKENSKKLSGDNHWMHKEGAVHPTKGKTYEEIHGIEKSIKMKKHLSKIASKQLKDGLSLYMNSMIKNPSRPQIELFHLAQQIYPYSYLNYPCFYSNKSIDIGIPDLSIALEYDGSYWHQDKIKDDQRQQLLESHGWHFLRYIDEVPTLEKLKKDILSLTQYIEST